MLLLIKLYKFENKIESDCVNKNPKIVNSSTNLVIAFNF